MPAVGWEPPGHRSTRYEQPTTAQHGEGLAEMLLTALFTGVWQLLRGLWWLLARYPVPVVAVVGFTAAELAGVGGQAFISLVAMSLVYVGVRMCCRDWWQQRIAIPRQRRAATTAMSRDWPVLCDRVGMTVTDRDRRTGAVTESTPGLSDLAWNETGTALTGVVQLVPGQLVDDLGEVAERLGEAMRAQQCRIVRTAPGRAQVTLLFGDPLLDVVPPLPVPVEPDVSALPVGVREDGGSGCCAWPAPTSSSPASPARGRGRWCGRCCGRSGLRSTWGRCGYGRSTARPAWNSRPAALCSPASPLRWRTGSGCSRTPSRR